MLMTALQIYLAQMDMSLSSRGILAAQTSPVTARQYLKLTILTSVVKPLRARAAIVLWRRTDALLLMQATLSKWVGYQCLTMEVAPWKQCYAARQGVCRIRMSLYPTRVVSAHQAILHAELGLLRTIPFVTKIRPIVLSMLSNSQKHRKQMLMRDSVTLSSTSIIHTHKLAMLQ